jgi:hypothetical protein
VGVPTIFPECDLNCPRVTQALPVGAERARFGHAPPGIGQRPEHIGQGLPLCVPHSEHGVDDAEPHLMELLQRPGQSLSTPFSERRSAHRARPRRITRSQPPEPHAVATGLIGVEQDLHPLQQHEGIPAREEATERVRIGREDDSRHLPESVGESAGTVLGEFFGKEWVR